MKPGLIHYKLTMGRELVGFRGLTWSRMMQKGGKKEVGVHVEIIDHKTLL
jgi:hypothetical protein